MKRKRKLCIVLIIIPQLLLCAALSGISLFLFGAFEKTVSFGYGICILGIGAASLMNVGLVWFALRYFYLDFVKREKEQDERLNVLREDMRKEIDALRADITFLKNEDEVLKKDWTVLADMVEVYGKIYGKKTEDIPEHSD